MNDDILEGIYKRYQNDPAFHSLVMTMVQAQESGALNRSDFFDALRLADKIVFEHQIKLMEEWHDRT